MILYQTSEYDKNYAKKNLLSRRKTIHIFHENKNNIFLIF